MKIGSAIAQVLSAYGLDILNVPSRFEDALLQLLDKDSPEAAAIEEGCDATYLGFFIRAADSSNADELDKASERATAHLHNMYGVDEGIARELSEAISDAVAEHMDISMGSGSTTSRMPQEGETVSSWNPLPQPVQGTDTFHETFTGFEDIFTQDNPYDTQAYGNQPLSQTGMTAPVGMGDGWTTQQPDVPSTPTAPVVQQQKKPQVPLVAMLAAVGLVGAIGVGVGVGMNSSKNDPEPVVQEQPVTTDDPEKEEPAEEPAEEPEEPTEEETTTDSGEVDRAKQLALEKAEGYLEFMAFSHDGLVASLEYDGFNHEEALYAADNCGADWDEQAVRMAKDYLDSIPFSESELIDQLEFEEFTTEQAKHGVAECGADWMEQAVLKAKEYLEYDPDMSKDDVLEMLEFDGFTDEQAQHGVDEAFK